MWLLHFMQGRYGFDELGRHLGMLTIGVLIASVVVGVLGTLVFDITPWVRLGALLNLVSVVLNWGWIALTVWMFYRVLSRKIDRRRAENERFLERQRKHREKRGGRGSRQQSGTHGPRDWARSRSRSKGDDISRGEAGYTYLTCPFCGQKMRVPQGKGKIAVKCPSCGEKTIVNS